MLIIWAVTILFMILSIPLLMGKGSWLIAGYNTSSREEKEKYDEKKLCRAMGFMCAIIGIMSGLLGIINTESFAIVYAVLITIIVIITLIYTNTKCKKN